MNSAALFGGTAVAFALATGLALSAPLDAAAFADPNTPLDVTTLSSSSANGVASRLVTFRSGRRTVTAEIVAPEAASVAGPGVLFVHWLGVDKTTNHTEFEPDARALAKRGATCVLIDAMWSTVATKGVDWFDKVRSTETDYAASIAQVVDLRRALDLLLAQPRVDSQRVAYVGHDFGAMYGAVLAGVDPRPRFYFLMAGTTTFSQWYLLGAKPSNITAYVAQMTPLDPLPYLSRSKAQAFGFQFAEHDRYVSLQQANAFANASPLPRAFFLYDAHHDLTIPDADVDRLAWLRARLWP